MAHFGGIALEEVPAGRHVEEQVLHGNAGAIAVWQGSCCLMTLLFYFYVSAQLVAGCGGSSVLPGYGGNGSQRLAAETHGADVKKIVYGLYLGSSMALKAHARIRYHSCRCRYLITCTSSLPASLIKSWISVSAGVYCILQQFSSRAEAGRWITSPAAIWFAILSGNKLMISATCLPFA